MYPDCDPRPSSRYDAANWREKTGLDPVRSHLFSARRLEWQRSSSADINESAGGFAVDCAADVIDVIRFLGKPARS